LASVLEGHVLAKRDAALATVKMVDQESMETTAKL
jgi:hypothetical protein